MTLVLHILHGQFWTQFDHVVVVSSFLLRHFHWLHGNSTHKIGCHYYFVAWTNSLLLRTSLPIVFFSLHISHHPMVVPLEFGGSSNHDLISFSFLISILHLTSLQQFHGST
jgi:hypothetical protein